MKSDDELKQLLAKMLPETVRWHPGLRNKLYWRDEEYTGVLDTELLHLCALVESTIIRQERNRYNLELTRACTGYALPEFFHSAISATWQQRTEALAQVLEVTL